MRKISWILLGFIALSTLGQLSAGITVINAKYGVLKKKRQTKDVTTILKSEADGKGRYEINANGYSELFGNPAKKKEKQLRVKYNDGIRDQEITVSEKKDLILVAAPQPEIPPEPKPEAKTEFAKQLTKEECDKLFDLLSKPSRENMDKVRTILGLVNLRLEFSEKYGSESRSGASGYRNESDLWQHLRLYCPRCGNCPKLVSAVKAAGFNSVGDFLKFKVSASPEYQFVIVEKWKKFSEDYINRIGEIIYVFSHRVTYSTTCKCGLSAKELVKRLITTANGLDDL